MALIDRMDWLSGCGGSRGAETGEREPETRSAYRLSLHLLLLPSLREHFFLTGCNRCCSPLIYHSEELNVDTSKYFHTHGSPGACVFSLFKMERPNPSLAVCDGGRSFFAHEACVCLHRHRGRLCCSAGNIPQPLTHGRRLIFMHKEAKQQRQMLLLITRWI